MILLRERIVYIMITGLIIIKKKIKKKIDKKIEMYFF